MDTSEVATGTPRRWKSKGSKMKKKIFLFLLAFLAGVVLFSLPKQKILAASCRGDCPSWENWCGGDFPFPLPTGFPWPTLKPCPEPTLPPPTVTPTPTPTPFPGEPTPTPTSPPPGGGAPSGEGGVGGATPYHCGAAVPLESPTLTSVTPVGGGQMSLAWTPVSPVTHYALVYGPSSGNYLYGVANTGNVTSFTVGGLDPGENYCFAVRGVNDCAPGSLSNERCSGAVLGAEGQVLGFSSTSGSSNPEHIFYIIGILWIWAGLRLYLAKKST